MKNLLEAMHNLKENSSKRNLNKDNIEFCIKRHLQEMFYETPRIDITSYSNNSFRAQFSMSESDYNPTSNQIKKWFKEDFDLSNYKVSVKTLKHSRLTLGRVRFTVNIDTINNLEESAPKVVDPTDEKFLAKVRKRFENLSYTTGREYKVDNPKEFDLDKWTLRDYVAEAHYELNFRKSELHDQYDRQEFRKYKRFVDAYKDLLTPEIGEHEKHGDRTYDL